MDTVYIIDKIPIYLRTKTKITPSSDMKGVATRGSQGLETWTNQKDRVDLD